MKITINGIEYTLKFGYGVLRLLAEKWCEPGVQGVLDRFNNIAGREIDTCVDMVHCAIEAGGKSCHIDEVGDHLLSRPEVMNEVIAAFGASMPQAKPEDAGKPIAPEAVEKNP